MNNLSIVILCTNIIKGTKSLGSMGLLKITNKKNLIDYYKRVRPSHSVLVLFYGPLQDWLPNRSHSKPLQCDA